MRKYLLLSILLVFAVVQTAAATVSLSSVSGHPGDTVDVTVSISDPGSATAIELDIPVPDDVSFVPKSVGKLASSGHSVL